MANSDPQPESEPNRRKLLLLAILALLLLGSCWLFFSSPLRQRLGWEADKLTTYARGMLYPADKPPTPSSKAEAKMFILPTASSSPAAGATPSASPTPIPEVTTLQAPAWEKQALNDCGPATLAMVLRYYGWKGTQADIANKIKPDPSDRNVNIEELADFTRSTTSGLKTESRVGGSLVLLKQLVAAGFPVMIEEGLATKEPYWPNDDRWAGHYLLITGYDEPAGEFLTQDSFEGPNRKVAYSSLDASWKAFNRVYFLLYPPDREKALRWILGSDWDFDTNRDHALRAAEAEVQQDPRDAFAWFNRGTNLVYFERYPEAVQAFDTARSIGLPQRMYRYQFGPFIAYYHTGQINEMLSLVEYALQRTPNSEEALLWKGWGMVSQGDRDEARRNFQAALSINPSYGDARKALDTLK
jgi:tetratricopeptide (TPR) repeat protein